jgi:hypothetical protein
MSEPSASREYLVISRGQWDATRSPEDIQRAIDDFYVWLDRLRMRPGQRLATDGKVVRRGAITDGPFAETKEAIGGYWFILADSLDEAAEIAAGNPCLECGLLYEIRPIDPERASAFVITTETPPERRAHAGRHDGVEPSGPRFITTRSDASFPSSSKR